MENFIVVILFVIGIVFNVIKNFNKEKELAKKRMPQQKPIPIPTTTNVNIPKVEPIKKKEVQKKNKQPYEYIPEEVLAVKKRKEAEKIEKMERRVELKDDMATEEQPFSFDLRTAVIQSAILDRPYK